MTRRHLPDRACTAAVVASGLAAAPSADHRSVHRVTPGESIQKAVDAAEPGDTVLIAPGTYKESVSITVSDVTLRGSGAGRTVLVPGTGKDASAEAGNGICVTGPDKEPLKDVSVPPLPLRGYEQTCLW